MKMSSIISVLNLEYCCISIMKPTNNLNDVDVLQFYACEAWGCKILPGTSSVNLHERAIVFCVFLILTVTKYFLLYCYVMYPFLLLSFNAYIYLKSAHGHRVSDKKQ